MPSTNHHLILASQSPRRSELLKKAGYTFTVLPVQISEILDENLNLHERIRQLAVDKARACLESGILPKQQGNLILGADTVVVLGDQILGKPNDRKENSQSLRLLSGQMHRVITGVCLLEVNTGQLAVGHDETHVYFRDLTDTEIETYVSTGEGLDKAGGYGIQGLAQSFVAKRVGSLDTVIGLPVLLVTRLLAEHYWSIAVDCTNGEP